MRLDFVILQDGVVKMEHIMESFPQMANKNRKSLISPTFKLFSFFQQTCIAIQQLIFLQPTY